MRTSSQSQLCFGDVEVRRESSAGNGERIRRRDVAPYPTLARKNELRLHDGTVPHLIKMEENSDRKISNGEPFRLVT